MGQERAFLRLKTKFGVIYLVWNLVNGRCYVGQTVDFLRRKSNHLTGNHSSRALSAAVAKYGRCSFRVLVIESCPIQDLDAREVFWIASLNTFYPSGYNLNTGGGGTRGQVPWNKGRVGAFSEDSCRMMSESSKGNVPWNKGLKMSVEYCEKLSESHKGQVPWNKGKKIELSEEGAKSISNANRGNQYARGYRHTVASRRLMSESARGNRNAAGRRSKHSSSLQLLLF